MARASRILAWTLAGGVFALLLLAGAFVLIVESRPGHDFFLRMALRQIPRYVHGEVEIGGIRSDGLLRGFLLRDISIHDEGGRPFLIADSVRVGYSATDLLARRLVLVPVESWGMQVTVETLPGDTLSNLQRIFPAGESAEDPVEPPLGFSLGIRDVTITDGGFLLRLPHEAGAPPGPTGVVEALPDLDGEVLTFRFTEIQADLTEGVILDPDGGGMRFDFEHLALDAHLADTPLELDDFRGEVEVSASEIVIAADRLWFPGTEFAGNIGLDLSDPDRGVRVEADLEAPVFTLSDFHSILPGVPEAEGQLSLSFSGYPDDGEVEVATLDLRTDRSRISGSVGLALATRTLRSGSAIEIQSLDLGEVAALVPDLPELTGVVSGRIEGSGSLESLTVQGALTYADLPRGVPATPLRFDGGIRIAEDPGFRAFTFAADPLDYAVLNPFLSETVLTGTGRISGTLSGRLASGVTLEAEVVHAVPEHPTSHLTLSGTVSQPGSDLILDLRADVAPLSLDGLGGALGVTLPASGELTGEILARGSFQDLALSAALVSLGGTVRADAQLDLTDPDGSYIFEGEVEDFLAHPFLPNVPDSTRMTGEFLVEGRGRSLETLDTRASLNLRDSKVAGVELERMDLRLFASGGMLRVEELELMAPLLRLSGTGNLPLVDDHSPGEVLIVWNTASLDVLRPLIFGPNPIASDTLSALDLEVLRVGGVDTDTIAASERNRMEGSARGELRLAGSITELSGDGFVEVEELIYGENEVGAGRADFVGSWTEGSEWRAEGGLELQQISVGAFGFEQAGGEVRLGPGAARFSMHLDRTVTESYRIAGALLTDSASTSIELDDMVLRIEDATWALLEPARFHLVDSTFTIESFRVARPSGSLGGEDVRIEATGTLGRTGAEGLRIEASRLELDRIERILQREDLPDGIMDLGIEISGPLSAPVINGNFLVEELAENGDGLTTLEGEFDYLDRRLAIRVDGEVEGRSLVALDGSLPLDLALTGVEGDRLLDSEMDLTLTIDELPASFLAVFLSGIEEVEGTLDGEVVLGGTPRDFRPNGRVLLTGGSLLLPELGIRPSAIEGEFLLEEDGTLLVNAESRSPGTLRASGSVALSNLRDPGFSLAVEASGFQAVDRRDLAARIGGSVVLSGSFTAPVVSGTVRVEEGEMFLDEFVRSAEVVRLSDRLNMDYVDTTVVSLRPVIEAAQNPFIENLFVQVDLEIARDFWLRSREMDVEMEGALQVTFDRRDSEIVMSGILDATRGNYNSFGRQFQVAGGSVEFAGTPGINPSLNIQAVTRLRRPGGEPLNITATVGGTLISPSVELSSDAQPAIAEADLYSYLIFGRPSYALASGESSALAGAAGAGLTLGIGSIASQLGSVVAREIGLDYFTITQDQEGTGIESIAGLSNSFVGTQIEVGQYVRDNLFLAFVLRPISGVGSGSRIPGARLEWTFDDAWSLEGFVEDRFAREGASGFGELGLRLSKVLGLSLFREWGY